MVSISALCVFGVFTYTFYKYNFSTVLRSSNSKFNLGLIRLGSIGAIIDTAKETIVSLTDAELNGLLQLVFNEIGSSNVIYAELLVSLGLYTPTIIEYLLRLGYIIVS